MSTATTKERPILFSPMLAGKVHDGSKTMTRRVVKRGHVFKFCAGGDLSVEQRARINAEPFSWDRPTDPTMDQLLSICPYGVSGDRLWVRESVYIDHMNYSEGGPLPKVRPPEIDDDMIYYRANGTCCEQVPECQHDNGPARFRPSLHMPRWACRTVVEILSVKVERVQDITEEDAIADGFCLTRCGANCDYEVDLTARENFLHTFYDLNKRAPRDTNPWVWVLAFKKVEDLK